jgi:hypothetical protein
MVANLFGGGFMNGLLAQNAPRIIKGFMCKYLGSIQLNDMMDWITANKNLWDEIPAQYKLTLKDYGPKLGDLSWFNSEWLIQTARESAPALASLFLGWDEGREWLDRQIVIIKNNIKEGC